MKRVIFSLTILVVALTVSLAVRVQAAPTRFESTNYGIESVIFGATGTLRSQADSVPPIITNGPTVSDIQTNSVTISWRTNKAANSIVLIGESSGIYSIQFGQIDQAIYTDHQVQVSQLKKGATYFYQVRSSDVSGNLAQSAESTFTTDPGDVTAPRLVSGPTITQNSATSITVTWETDEISNTLVEYGLKDVAENAVGRSEELTLFHQVNIDNLAASQAYLLRVKSKDPSGNIFTGQTLQLDTPSTPSIANVRISDITLNSGLVQWNSSTPTNSLIRYGTVSGVYDQQVSDAAYTQNHLLRLSGLTSGTTYYVRISGADQSKNQLLSDEYVFKTVVLPIISDVTVKKVTADTAIITWTSSSDIDEFIRYTISKTDESKLFGKQLTAGNDVLVSQHTFQLNDLESSTEYTVSLSGKDVFGNQAQSGNIKFTTAPDTQPPQIMNIKTDTTVDLGSKQSVQVLVSFGLSKPSTSIIEYGEGAGSTYNKKVTLDTELTTNKFLVIPDLKPGVSYHFHIVATDKRGNQATSADYLVLAPAQTVSLLDLIFGQISNNFGWLRNL